VGQARYRFCAWQGNNKPASLGDPIQKILASNLHFLLEIVYILWKMHCFDKLLFWELSVKNFNLCLF